MVFVGVAQHRSARISDVELGQRGDATRPLERGHFLRRDGEKSPARRSSTVSRGARPAGAAGRLDVSSSSVGTSTDQVDVEVAASAPVQVLDALVTESGARCRWRCPRLDVDRRGLAQGRHLDGRAEGGLGEGDVRLVVQVVAVSFEAAVVLHAQVHEEATVGSPARAGRPAVAQAHGRAVLDAGRDLDRQRRRLVDAGRRRGSRRTGVSMREPMPLQRVHGIEVTIWPRIELRTRAPRPRRRTPRRSPARSRARNPNRRTWCSDAGRVTVTSLRRAEGGVIERDVERRSRRRVRAGVRAAVAVTAEPAEEHVEDVLDRAGPEGIAAGADVGAEAVVVGASIGVREDLVGLGDLLEARLGRRVAGVGVGVVLARESPVAPSSSSSGLRCGRPRAPRTDRC